MVTHEKIEEYLINTGMSYQLVQEGMWLIHDEHDAIDNIVLLHTPPVITFRVKIMKISDIPKDKRMQVYKHLLELNASEMVAGAYGLEDDAVVIIDSLQSENLDYNEFQASLDSMTMSIRQHYAELREMIPAPEQEGENILDMSTSELEASIRQGN